jgi:DNA-binding SARP family transcriptional activator/DNA-binding beta-propeller fold protein YncE
LRSTGAVLRSKAEARVEFRILGPLEVVDEGRPVSIRRGKELALLAYLLLHANEVVPRERLIDQLWDERPPATAPKILHNAVSHLRKQLGNGRLVTREPGYLLRVADEELDLQRFERLAREGRHEEALALWRGPPLLELRDERFADDARRRLEEQHLGVLEERIEADLAAGRGAALVPELEELIAAHPLREPLYAALMLALYRAGRQSDALDTYQRARTALSHELGLEPGPQLRELERKILTQDPGLAATARAEPRLPAPLLRAPRNVRIGLGAAAVLLVIAAAISVGLIFTLDDDSKRLVVRPNSLVVVDPNSNSVVDVAPVGTGPRGVAVSSDSVWVANAAEGTVSQLDLDTLRPIRTVGIGAQATDLVSAAGAVWVVTGIDDTLVKVDERSGGVRATFQLSTRFDSSAYAVAARDEVVWATSGGALFKIDAATDATLGVHGSDCCGSVRDVAVGAGSVWIAQLGQSVVRVSASTTRRTGELDLGFIPTALTASHGSVWTASSTGTQLRLVLWRIDPTSLRVTQTVPLGNADSFLATVDVAAGAGAIWATNYAERTLIRVNPDSGAVEAKIRLGARPHAVTVGAGRVWVTVD